MTGCRSHGDLIGPYVLGALEPDEMEEMRRHLAGCDRCAAERRRLAVAARAARQRAGRRQDRHALPAARGRGARPLRAGSARRPRRPRRRLAATRDTRRGGPAPWSSRPCSRSCSPAAASAAYARAELWSIRPGRVLGSASAAEVAGRHAREAARPRPSGARTATAYELWCVRTDGRWISGGSFHARADGTASARAHRRGPSGRVPRGRGHRAARPAGSAARRSCAASSCTEPPPEPPAYNRPCAPSPSSRLLCALALGRRGLRRRRRRRRQLGRRSARPRRNPVPTAAAERANRRWRRHAQTLKLSADPGGALKFDKSTLTAKAGKVTIVLDNPSVAPARRRDRGERRRGGERARSARARPRRSAADREGRRVRVLLPGRRPQGRRHGGHAHRCSRRGARRRRRPAFPRAPSRSSRAR